MSVQSESVPATAQHQLAMLEDAWLGLLSLPPAAAHASLERWAPLAQHLINRGHGQVLLAVLEGVCRQASIRSQRQVLLELCAATFVLPQGSGVLQRQWLLLQRWLA